MNLATFNLLSISKSNGATNSWISLWISTSHLASIPESALRLPFIRRRVKINRKILESDRQRPRDEFINKKFLTNAAFSMIEKLVDRLIYLRKIDENLSVYYFLFACTMVTSVIRCVESLARTASTETAKDTQHSRAPSTRNRRNSRTSVRDTRLLVTVSLSIKLIGMYNACLNTGRYARRFNYFHGLKYGKGMCHSIPS